MGYCVFGLVECVDSRRINAIEECFIVCQNIVYVIFDTFYAVRQCNFVTIFKHFQKTPKIL